MMRRYGLRLVRYDNGRGLRIEGITRVTDDEDAMRLNYLAWQSPDVCAVVDRLPDGVIWPRYFEGGKK